MISNELEVIPLGTVSPYCYEDKNCPGFLVKYNDTKVLLDCGNGICRYLNLPDDLENLVIIISHFHYDHYGELLSIANASNVLYRLGYITDKIKVYIPYNELEVVEEYCTYMDEWGNSIHLPKNIIDYDYLLSLEKNGYLKFITYDSDDNLSIDDLKISFCENPHQMVSHSIKIEVDDLKLVYSGDTGYKENCLEEFAKSADLLICEASLIKGQLKESDGHLYAYEAGKIAKSANVERLLLTHFWPDIDKQKYVDEAKKVFFNTSAAEEGKKLVLKRKRGE